MHSVLPAGASASTTSRKHLSDYRFGWRSLGRVCGQTLKRFDVFITTSLAETGIYQRYDPDAVPSVR
ncbi:MAG: hypothetical protein QOJ51_817 [Acidobacteriaceae bacterium]|nr:hypothetical protein [Acidobacteriaceae bacterium]